MYIYSAKKPIFLHKIRIRVITIIYHLDNIEWEKKILK